MDHVSETDPVDGVLLVDQDYLTGKRVFAQLVCSFRYGREEDETLGLSFKKELTLADEQIFPPPSGSDEKNGLTRLQERLLKKLGTSSIPFTLTFPRHSPTSVTLAPNADDPPGCLPCGVEYYIRCYVLEAGARPGQDRRSAVSMTIRKIQYAPTRPGRQPCTVVKKDFMFSPGELELEATLDRQLYHHGDSVVVNISVRNNSNKMVKKITASILQCIDIAMFQGGHCKVRVATLETTEGCPINPGSTLQKSVRLTPAVSAGSHNFRHWIQGVALDGRVRGEEADLASSTLLADENSRDIFGMVISYTAKVKLFLGAIGGELSAELPFILMHPKPNMKKILKADTMGHSTGSTGGGGTYEDNSGFDPVAQALENMSMRPNMAKDKNV